MYKSERPRTGLVTVVPSKEIDKIQNKKFIFLYDLGNKVHLVKFYVIINFLFVCVNWCRGQIISGQIFIVSRLNPGPLYSLSQSDPFIKLIYRSYNSILTLHK